MDIAWLSSELAGAAMNRAGYWYRRRVDLLCDDVSSFRDWFRPLVDLPDLLHPPVWR
jgi:hypothetical protein